ncbi:hypothetical protein [Leptolyngbya sp. FACHB-711]|uniref:hypothetical protein n=1 Tax=unclassified Leptolyngbya TaxID=2650499 RepID=UPI00168916D2|nr:hypothetical protein [Leptolyngbya sp. FACHB-711]MBD1852015.1 hypothetical protein [Cyanobacteria bacterium FACHB-502]MBD2026301.1 hypothetical protein [Leptolyngbya sp. FACHB-711]
MKISGVLAPQIPQLWGTLSSASLQSLEFDIDLDRDSAMKISGALNEQLSTTMIVTRYQCPLASSLGKSEFGG